MNPGKKENWAAKRNILMMARKSEIFNSIWMKIELICSECIMLNDGGGIHVSLGKIFYN